MVGSKKVGEKLVVVGRKAIARLAAVRVLDLSFDHLYLPDDLCAGCRIWPAQCHLADGAVFNAGNVSLPHIQVDQVSPIGTGGLRKCSCFRKVRLRPVGKNAADAGIDALGNIYRWRKRQWAAGLIRSCDLGHGRIEARSGKGLRYVIEQFDQLVRFECPPIREHIKVDRVACSWLIRRFINPDAQFLFVDEGQLVESAARSAL